MDKSESDRAANIDEQAGRTSSASKSEGTAAGTAPEKGAEPPSMREGTSEGLRELVERARDAITDKPEIATLSAFAVGIVTGVLPGMLLARD